MQRLCSRITSLKKRLAEIAVSPWFYPCLLGIFLLLAYAPQLVRPGFFWDDWQAVWLARFQDPQVYWNYFLYDRPFSAWTYVLTIPLFGQNPAAWQLFTLAARWAAILACWRLLLALWPGRRWEAAWFGLLLAIYPGFKQQAVSVAYSQHFTALALCTFSLWAMVAAARRPGRSLRWTLPALAASVLNLLTMEYFLGLELLRPLLLWIALAGAGVAAGKRFARTLRQWLPYLGILVIFIAYRLLVYPRLLPVPDPNAPALLEMLGTRPLAALQQLAQLGLQDFVHATLFAWAGTVAPDTILLASRMLLLSWVLGLVIAGLVAMLVHPIGSVTGSDVAKDSFLAWGLPLGVIAVLLGGLPVWLTNRQAIVGMWSDRFTLAMMPGAALLMVWLPAWLDRGTWRRSAALALVLGLAFAAQFRTAHQYGRAWEVQRDFYWQLAWRAPALQPGSVLVAPETPLSLVSDYAIGFALDSIYAERPYPHTPQAWFLNAGRTWAAEDQATWSNGTDFAYTLRNITIRGTLEHAVGFNYNPGRGCLRILDPQYLEAPTLSSYPAGETEQRLYRVSHPQRINSQASESTASRLARLFGKEPAHGWCYFYQQGDLARREGDWEVARRLWEQAAAKGLQPRSGAEFLPFIEAYSMLGDWPKAAEISLQAGKSGDTASLVCHAWERLLQSTEESDSRTKAFAEVQGAFSCPPD